MIYFSQDILLFGFVFNSVKLLHSSLLVLKDVKMNKMNNNIGNIFSFTGNSCKIDNQYS